MKADSGLSERKLQLGKTTLVAWQLRWTGSVKEVKAKSRQTSQMALANKQGAVQFQPSSILIKDNILRSEQVKQCRKLHKICTAAGLPWDGRNSLTPPIAAKKQSLVAAKRSSGHALQLRSTTDDEIRCQTVINMLCYATLQTLAKMRLPKCNKPSRHVYLEAKKISQYGIQTPTLSMGATCKLASSLHRAFGCDILPVSTGAFVASH